MISSVLPVLDPDFFVAVFFGVLCFVAGVAYAAYRAVGWVERMRTWAYTVEVEDAS